MNVSVISAGGELVAVGLLFGLGDIATKEVFEWAIGNSNTVRACGEVSRFMDDMADFAVWIIWSCYYIVCVDRVMWSAHRLSSSYCTVWSLIDLVYTRNM